MQNEVLRKSVGSSHMDQPVSRTGMQSARRKHTHRMQSCTCLQSRLVAPSEVQPVLGFQLASFISIMNMRDAVLSMFSASCVPASYQCTSPALTCPELTLPFSFSCP